MNKYRDRLQIVADILSTARVAAKKTRIMYQANLSYRLLCRYLEEALGAGLVSCVNGDCYLLTAKGEEFLQRHEEYSKRCERVQEHLNHINSEKAVLESMCLNASVTDRNLNGRGRNRQLRK